EPRSRQRARIRPAGGGGSRGLRSRRRSRRRSSPRRSHRRPRPPRRAQRTRAPRTHTTLAPADPSSYARFVRALTGTIQSYDAPSTEAIAQRVGLPAAQIVRFDGNTSPHVLPSTRAEALTEELARIHTYPHGGYPQLERAIAEYAGVACE